MTVEVREPTEEDLAEVSEVVETAMQASYALSPQEIEQIVEEEFQDDPLDEKVDRDETVLLVAESGEEAEDRSIAGVVEGHLEGDHGEIDWLFVETAQRGRGVGTELFEAVSDQLRDAGAEDLRTNVLDSNTEGQQFIERFDFEHVDEHEFDVGDQAYAENVYASPDAHVESDRAPKENEEVGDDELPGTETEDGQVTATDEDGTTVYLDTDDDRSGTEGRFLDAYESPDHEEKFGFYCSNCGSLRTTMDNMERIECSNCGNRHVSRSSEEYDDTYL